MARAWRLTVLRAHLRRNRGRRFRINVTVDWTRHREGSVYTEGVSLSLFPVLEQINARPLRVHTFFGVAMVSRQRRRADLTRAVAATATIGLSGRGWSALIVYDFGPGVIVRSLLVSTVGQSRHYFPRTAAGQSSVVLSTGLRAGFRSRSYYRYWSVSSVFAPQQVSPGYRCPRIAIAIAAVNSSRRRRLAT